MQHTRKYTAPADATPGFSIQLEGDTKLGLTMLVVDDAEGHYEPSGVASTVNEARELADSHFRAALKARPFFARCIYRVWARRVSGAYTRMVKIFFLLDSKSVKAFGGPRG
jgi:hypothetical protein